MGAAPGVSPAPQEVFATEKGQRTTVRFADGMLVHLNTNVRFAAYERFDSDKRQEQPEGEAS